MAQEFTIKSEQIEAKINQLLPSQGGFGAGVDFSASTMVIPIVDLTETAEGSSLRQDLQTSLSLTTATAFDISDATTTIINTTGYYTIDGRFYGTESTTQDFPTNQIRITDGTTTKVLWNVGLFATGVRRNIVAPFNLTVKLEAGDSVDVNTSNGGSLLTRMVGVTRQIADINGNLVNP